MKSLNGIAHSIEAATGYSNRTAATDRRRSIGSSKRQTVETESIIYCIFIPRQLPQQRLVALLQHPNLLNALLLLLLPCVHHHALAYVRLILLQ